MAVIEILDTFIMHSKSKKKTVLAIYDFSNAYCTVIHNVTLEIARRFNLSDRIMTLLEQFLKQTFSTIKMNDKNGYYQSQEINTGDGMQQGQIGSGFIFALINDNIDPLPVINAIIERIKYVDDFNDVIASDWASAITKCIEANIDHLLKQATSVGLKLNDDKTKFLFSNMTEQEIRDVLKIFYPESKIEKAYADVQNYTHKLLGFEFGVRNNQVTVNAAIENATKRLNGCVRVVSSMRKSGNSITRTKFRIEVATKMIWSACYDIGLCYSYCTNPEWNRIETCIRKVVKSAGIDWLTNRNVIYQISTIFPQTLWRLNKYYFSVSNSLTLKK